MIGLDVTSVARASGQVPPPWNTRHCGPGGVPPALTLDFERCVYGQGRPEWAWPASLNFARDGVKTVADRSGLLQEVPDDTPAFDWSGGRRGLHCGVNGGAPDQLDLDLGTWWSGSGGAIVCDFTMVSTNGGFDRVFEINDGLSAASRISLLYHEALGRFVLGVYDGGVAQAVLTGPETAYSLGTTARVAVSFAAGSFAISVNGAAPLSQGAGALPSGLTQMNIASAFGFTNIPELVMHSLVYHTH
ncbi:hypothetical protein [Thalassobius sp. MITS945101]|uniref:hypothetical protein n=1 Tax=Thalassobius sp. MITS945101 TaxID=3096994 RepID=UPI00399BED56